jgi:hypothetical protein
MKKVAMESTSTYWVPVWDRMCFLAGFEVFPIVLRFIVVVLIGKDSDDIHNGKPPFTVLFIPNGTNFTVVEKTDGYFEVITHH